MLCRTLIILIYLTTKKIMNYTFIVRSVVLTITVALVATLIPLRASAHSGDSKWIPLSFQGASSYIWTLGQRQQPQHEHPHPHEQEVQTPVVQPQIQIESETEQEQPEDRQPEAQPQAPVWGGDIQPRNTGKPVVKPKPIVTPKPTVTAPQIHSSTDINHRAIMYPEEGAGSIPAASFLLTTPEEKCETQAVDITTIWVQGCQYEVEVRNTANGEVAETHRKLSGHTAVIFPSLPPLPNGISIIWVKARARVVYKENSHESRYGNWSNWTAQHRVYFEEASGFMMISTGTTTRQSTEDMRRRYEQEQEEMQRQRLYTEGGITVKVTNISYDSVTLSWSLPTGDTAAGYEVRKRNKAVDGDFVYAPIRTGSAATTYTVTGLSPETRYGFSIKALGSNRRGDRTISPIVDATTTRMPRYVRESMERAAEEERAERRRAAEEELARKQAEIQKKIEESERKRREAHEERIEQELIEQEQRKFERWHDYWTDFFSPFTPEVQKAALRMFSCKMKTLAETGTLESEIKEGHSYHNTVIPGVAEGFGHPEWLDNLDCATYNGDYDIIHLIETMTGESFF